MTLTQTVAAANGGSYLNNGEFLEAKFQETMLMLELAGLRRQFEMATPTRKTWLDRPEPEVPSTDTTRPLDLLEHEYLEHRACAESRLILSEHVTIPFRELAARCGLEPLEQQVLWLLFFKTVSIEFREYYDSLQLAQFGQESRQEMCVGNVMQILCPGRFASQMDMRRHFSVGGRLFVHHLVRMEAGSLDRSSILEVELEMPQQVVAWITADTNRYYVDCPFDVEWPEDSLESLILPSSTTQQVLALVENYDDYRTTRERLGMDRLVSYGRGVAILEHGPPGTGKTLMARAIAQHTRRPLVSLRDRSGESQRWRDVRSELAALFREAQLRRGIVFIDECEKLCSRDHEDLPYILIELERSEAIVIMATNRPEVLAPELDRRFTLKVSFGPPDAADREDIWRLHLGEEVPLAADVDLGHLAGAYPMAGGYIKNAVVAAVNLALARIGDGEFELTQVDLETGAGMQQTHLGKLAGLVTRRHPRELLNERALPTEVRERVRRLARIAGNYQRTMEQWGMWRPSEQKRCGFRILLHGDYRQGLEAAEGMAAELDRAVDCVTLEALVEAGKISGEEQSLTDQVLGGSAGLDRVLVIADEAGLMGRLKYHLPDSQLSDVIVRLGRYNGVVVVVTSEDRVRLPKWARIFHERAATAGTLDEEARLRCWARALGERVPLSAGLDLVVVAREFVLSIAEIEAAAVRAALLVAGDGSGGELGMATVVAAVEGIGEEGGGVPLFG